MRLIVLGFALTSVAWPVMAATHETVRGPVELKVDNLRTPLGIDEMPPRFSWQLKDPAQGAMQTAYRIQVASRHALLAAGKADLWDSGRVQSDRSIDVRYSGKPLQPFMRCYWRVTVWDATGKPYPASEVTWWEEGLGDQDNWRAAWIGYETPEEHAVRQAPAEWVANPDATALASEKKPEQRYSYRKIIQLSKLVRHATLYATGQDSVSAWVNGRQVLETKPLPAWKQMPWKKFISADATGKLNPGANTLAIETVHYVANPNGMAVEAPPPMIATLVVEYTDGSWATFVSGTSWKTSIHATGGWQNMGFDDSGWKSAVPAIEATSSTAAQPLGNPWIPDSVKALRRTFTVTSPVTSARLYATALGAYEIFLNGRRVGDAVLAPGWTDYRERIMYQTYDVTAQLQTGKNAIAALLAPGWYETPLEWFQQPNNYGVTPPALRAQLRIVHRDGSVEWIATEPTWEANTSYILHSEIYDGESQDTRLIQPGWDTAAFVASGWKSAVAIDPKPVTIEAQEFPSIRVERAVVAKLVTVPKPGVFVYDLGQNLAGVERLRVQGPAGTRLRVRVAEIVNPDGTIYTDNLRTAKATDFFILGGKGVQVLTPQFTFHGFRYIQITGLATAPPKEDVAALVLHTAAPFTVQLETGSALVNKLWSNVLWGQRSNFVGVPTDCPQRDERLGWMADAQVFWRAAGYNMDLAAFSRKFASDIRGTQVGTPFYGIYAPGTSQPNSGSGAGWSDAGIVIPWTSWLQTGDTRIIDQNWDAMQRYLNAIKAVNPDWLWMHDSGTPFGDWLSPEGKTDYVLIATAYWAYDVTLMREMAHATGRTIAEEEYAREFLKIRAAFQKRFVRGNGFVGGADNSPSPFGQINNPNAKSSGGDTQTGYVLALHMNLLPDHLRATAAKRLADKIVANHGLLGTGFLGTPYLLQELSKAGYIQLAYQLLLNTQYPSWGYQVQHGATTIWERWNGNQMLHDPSMNSFNHYAYGAVAAWIYGYAAGVDATPLDAGFHTVLLHPVFDARLGHVHFAYDSQYGPIHSDWTVKGSKAVWHVTLPANTAGWLQPLAKEAGRFTLDGKPLIELMSLKVGAHGAGNGLELQSGSYTFEVDLK